MKPLPEKFTGNRDQRGFEFTQIKREGDVALYSKQKPETQGPTTYEVVIVRKVAERTFQNGITTPDHEIMPSPEEWGASGWSYPILEPALVRFEKCLKNRVV